MKSVANTESPDIITQSVVAKRYSVSQQTLSRWVNSCGFPVPVKIGRSLYWRLSDLQDYEATRRQRG